MPWASSARWPPRLFQRSIFQPKAHESKQHCERHCWTRTGDASITVGTDTDYALIPAQKAALLLVQSLNQTILLQKLPQQNSE